MHMYHDRMSIKWFGAHEVFNYFIFSYSGRLADFMTSLKKLSQSEFRLVKSLVQI